MHSYDRKIVLESLNRIVIKIRRFELRETKFVDGNFNQPGRLWITKNKIVDWNTVPPKAIVIEAQIMANFYRGLL